MKRGSLSSMQYRKLVLRCPMAHKFSENRYPGTVDEKLRCEVGTYIRSFDYQTSRSTLRTEPNCPATLEWARCCPMHGICDERIQIVGKCYTGAWLTWFFPLPVPLNRDIVAFRIPRRLHCHAVESTTCAITILENDGTPRTIYTSDTYSNTESFVSDMITLRDECSLSNPIAVYDAGDCRGQMAI